MRRAWRLAGRYPSWAPRCHRMIVILLFPGFLDDARGGEKRCSDPGPPTCYLPPGLGLSGLGWPPGPWVSWSALPSFRVFQAPASLRRFIQSSSMGGKKQDDIMTGNDKLGMRREPGRRRQEGIDMGRGNEAIDAQPGPVPALEPCRQPRCSGKSKNNWQLRSTRRPCGYACDGPA